MNVWVIFGIVAVTALIQLSAAADPECVFRKARGLRMHWPNPTDCGRFNRCTNKGVKREIKCPANKEYNEKTGKCGNVGRGFCSLSLATPLSDVDNLCSTEVDGIYLLNADYCRNFFICYENAAYPQSCPKGSSFNESVAACTPDEEHSCWENICVDQRNGSFIADTSSCRSYYICTNEEAVQQQCRIGSYYNTASNNCQPDVGGSLCWENLCVGKTDGTTVSDTTNCSDTYYTCFDQLPIEDKCPEGSYYNSVSQACEAGDCSDDDTTTQPPTDETECTDEIATTTPIPTAAPEENCTCPGGYMDGELVAHPENCMLFYICLNRELVEQSCEQGNYFDSNIRICVVDTNGECTDCQSTAYRAKRSVNHHKKKLATSKHKVNKHSKTTNATLDLCADPSANVVAAPGECNKFYVCLGCKALVQECCSGYYFNDDMKACVIDTDNTCLGSGQDVICEGEADGTTLPVATDKTQFYYCLGGIAHVYSCGTNQYYDAETGRCTNAGALDCDPARCAVDSSAFGTISGNDNNFCYCIDGNVFLGTCTNGIFNSTLGLCFSDAACDDDVCLITPEYTITPNSKDEHSFCMCLAGTNTVVNCPSNGIFNPTVGRCEASNIDPNCDPNYCQTQTEVVNFPSLTGNEGFCTCINGSPMYHLCENGYLFNEIKEICMPPSYESCDFNKCTEMGITFATEDDDTSFCYCTGVGQGTVIQCPNDEVYNPQIGVCMMIICNATYCNDPLNNGTNFVAENTSSGFCYCDGTTPKFEMCNNDETFDPQELVCVSGDGLNCDPNYCQTQTDVVNFPSLTGNEGFCTCINGSPIYHMCEDGYLFNEIQEICMPPSFESCDFNKCTDMGVTFATKDDDTSFCYCTGVGQGTVIQCPNNEVYLPEIGVCMMIVCDMTYCNDPLNNGTNFVAENTSSGFCYCDGTTPKFEMCNNDETFDPEELICMPDAEVECDIALCADASEDNIYDVPAINDIHGYCRCLSPVSVEKLQCPEGDVFDGSISQCTTDKSCTCPGGYTQNQAIPHPFDCQKYYVCNYAKLVELDCGEGNFYDVTSESCKANPNNAPNCIPVAADACDLALCANASGENIYDVPAIDDINGYCKCLGVNLAAKLQCPENYIFDERISQCTTDASCTCPGGYVHNQAIEHPFDCQKYYICNYTKLVEIDCGQGNFYDVTSDSCKANPNNAPNCIPVAATACDLALCANASAENIYDVPAINDIYGYCRCLGVNLAAKLQCPNDGVFNECLSQCATDASCTCPGGYMQNEVIEHPFDCQKYYICNYAKLVELDCGEGNYFDVTSESCKANPNNAPNCIPVAATACNLALCANASAENIYDVPAIDDINGYCRCLGVNLAAKLQCPNDGVFDEDTSECTTDASCTCPGGYTQNEVIEHPFDCQKYYVCNNAKLVELDCGEGNYFDVTSESCRANPNNAPNCTPVAAAACDLALCANASGENIYDVPAIDDINGYCRCLGVTLTTKLQCPNGGVFDEDTSECTAPVMSTGGKCPGNYEEGEMVAHPYSEELFYICYNRNLVEMSCEEGNIFDGTVCVQDTRQYKRSYYVENDVLCIDNEKRSVPSNCSQYEVCMSSKWQRQTCPYQRYYNPEQQKCLEPRDDVVCTYARVKGLPPCNAMNEHRTLAAKSGNCAQYYLCTDGKWRLKTCPKQHFYADTLQACLPSPSTDSDAICKAKTQLQTESNSNKDLHIEETTREPTKCLHTTVRYYNKNCAMYLMCMQGEWWYQYCPLGMYFNRTHNYCIPNDDYQCPDAARPVSLGTATFKDDFANRTCTHELEASLRPSIVNCDKYYKCKSGRWQSHSCAAGEFYSISAAACVADTDNVCTQLSAACSTGEKRSFPLNCTAYEQCLDGEWQRASCPRNWAFDDVLLECIPNDTSCASSGLRKVCRVGETRPLQQATNCSHFFFCLEDSWHIGSCFDGYMFSTESRLCVAHAANDKCSQVQRTMDTDVAKLGNVDGEISPCMGYEDGAFVQHTNDCSRFYVCYKEAVASDQQCALGSYFDSELSYCRPNDGSCHVPLSGVCVNATDGQLVPHPDECRAYYHCSTINGTQLIYCPEGEYYHNYTGQCRVDHGECQKPVTQGKCASMAHGTRLAHELYCNIYYACVRGLAIPVECPNNHQFSTVLSHCVYDETNQCQDGQLVNGTENSYSCGNLTDGSYLPDRSDCTRYYICSMGVALPKQCSASSYFDSQQLLCVPDDGSCPYVDDDDDQLNHQPVPPDPIVCEGQHGNMMPDPLNCNEFYVCINSKLRHERCYDQYFFNTTSYQCQQYPVSDSDGNAKLSQAETARGKQQQCTDEPISASKLCAEIPEDGSIAEPGDCRQYITCQENELITQQCRNGESYDSLLGFCRQNDGTCLLENGQRVGECNGLHGQLARNTENCRGYFVCINGQKIAGECEQDEYFSRTENMCQKDVFMTCASVANGSGSALTTVATAEDFTGVSCKGLRETVLYPYVYDNCRSYFHCVKGVPNVIECSDGLYFDASSSRCIKEVMKCIMPPVSVQRTPDASTAHTQLCELATAGRRYANFEDNCRSYYVCSENGTISYTPCPTGTLFSAETGNCTDAHNVTCHIQGLSLESSSLK